MKICRLQFKALLCLSLSLALGSLLFVPTTRASTNNALINYSLNYGGSKAGTVTAGTDQIMVCVANASSGYVTAMSWNGAAFTNLGINWGGYYNNAWYLVNPSVGSYTLSITYPNNLFAVHCAVYENVNQTTPINATSTQQTAAINTYTINQTGPTQIIALYTSATSVNGADITSDSTGLWSAASSASGYNGSARQNYGTRFAIADDSIATGWGNVANYYFIELNNVIPPPTLTITIEVFDSITQLLRLDGLCKQYGSGIGQMRIVGLADNATTSQPVLPDPLGVDRGMLVDCDGNYHAYYDGYGLIGTHWVAVDDTFYGTEWVTWEQDFSASSTPEWEFSYGYMSRDDPAGTASRLACSNEEWATPDPVIGIDWLSATTSVPAFNFTKIKCEIVKQYYISMFSLRDQAKSMGANSAAVLGNIFPFNFATAVKSAWTQSASSTLPTGLEFLNSENASGTISIPVKIGNATGSAPIWGTAIFHNNASSTAAFNSIRTVSTWLIRLAFFVLVFILGSKIYHEFNQTNQ